MGNERDASLDILKGFAVLCVVLGHINCVPVVKNFIYSFHMLLFMFLSGTAFYYAYKKYMSKIDKYIYIYILVRDKTAVLMLPYFFWSVFNTFVLQKSMRIYDLAAAPFTMFNFSKLWFLPTLFFISVIFGIIQIILFAVNKKDSYICELILLVGVLAIHAALLRYTGWKIFREILIYIVPFYFGFAMKKYSGLARIVSHSLVNSFCLIAFLVFTGMYDSTDKSVLILLTRFLSGVAFTIVSYSYVKQSRIPERLSRYLIFLGKNTLAIYVLHEYFRPIFINTIYGDAFIDTVARMGITVIIVIICILIKHILLTVSPQLSLMMFGIWRK